jgi:Sulfate permease family
MSTLAPPTPAGPAHDRDQSGRFLRRLVPGFGVIASYAKLGFIAQLISKPTMIGYMNGLALTILVGQLPKLFGFKVDAEGLIGEITGFIKGLADGEAVPAAAIIGIAGIAILNVFRRAWWPYDTERISLVFAELNGPVREKIERYGLTRTIDPRHFFPTVESAVAAFRQMTGAEWTAVGQATDDGTRPG